MKIICNQKDLTNSINIVQKAVSQKTTKPILKGILLESYDDKLKLTANDMSIGIETNIDAEIKEEGSIVLSSKLFGEIIRKLPQSTVCIELDENMIVTISCENSKFTLVAQKSDEFPNLPEVDEQNYFSINQNLLKDMIKKTIFAISQDESRKVLTGSLFQIEDGNLTIVSIDGYRLAIRKASIQFDKNIKYVVPGKTLSETLKILSLFDDNNDVKICFTDKHVLFNINNIKIISSLLEGDFINYSQIEPKEFTSKVNVSLNSIYQSIERASLLTRESKNSSIKLAIEDNNMNITSAVEVGSAQEIVPINLEGKNINIGFNPKYLLDALKVIDSNDIELLLNSNISPCIIKAHNDDNYIYIVLPVRLAN